MKGRKTYHGREAKKERLKEKKAPPTQKKVVVIGRAYTVEELQKLIAALSSDEVEVRVEAVAEFAENQSSISAGASKVPDISETQIVELILNTVRKDEEKLLKKFEKERREKALGFMADSSSMPLRVREHAAAVLRRLGLVKKEEKAEPLAIKDVYTPQQVKDLLARLRSRVRETRVAAAVEFIKEYARIIPTVSAMPMLTVTAVSDKAFKAINENPKPVLDLLVGKRMLKELLFLATRDEVHKPLRELAKQAAEKLQPEIPRPAAAEGEAEKKAPVQKQYTPLELEALLSGLGSVAQVRATKAAVEFLKNYDIIVQAIARVPMLTVTDVTKKAVKVIEGNLNAVLKELEKGKDIKALRFLAESSKFSEKARKKARVVLKIMMKPFDET